MRAYWALFRQQMIAGLQFRAGFWSRLLTNIFWGFARSAIIAAFYRYGSGEAALSLSQAVAMVWIQQIALNLMPGFGMDMSVWNKISRGDVAYDLARPLDIYNHWYVSAAAVKLAPFLLAIVPVSLAALMAPGDLALRISASPAQFFAGILTLMSGLGVSCAVILISYAALMDVNVGYAPANVIMIVSQILAGSILPLQLWPDFMQSFLLYQPFSSMLDLPLRFMTGSASLNQLPRVLLLQAVWGAALWQAGRAWIRRNLKKMILQGG